MLLIKRVLIGLTLVLLVNVARAKPSLEVKNGNIFYDEKQLTSSGIDSDPLLYLDGQRVYYIRHDVETSGSLRSINIDGSDDKYFGDCSKFEIVQSGPNKGNLIIRQHRYFLAGGGSYDWYYLFTPEGKELGIFGDDLKTVDMEAFLEPIPA